MMMFQRIILSPGFHAETPVGKGHLHDVYTTVPTLRGENNRLHVGQLTRDAVDAWKFGEDALCRIRDQYIINRADMTDAEALRAIARLVSAQDEKSGSMSTPELLRRLASYTKHIGLPYSEPRRLTEEAVRRAERMEAAPSTFSGMIPAALPPAEGADARRVETARLDAKYGDPVGRGSDALDTPEMRKSAAPTETSGALNQSLPRVEFHQHDFLPGFAAFLPGATQVKPESKAFCVVNLGSLLATVEYGHVPRADLPYFLAESMMHEVIHVLEQWAGVAFSEERVDGLLERYRAAAQADPPDTRTLSEEGRDTRAAALADARRREAEGRTP